MSYKLIGAVTDERAFSTDDHMREVQGKRWDGKNWDVANDAKLQGIVSNQGNFYTRLFVYAKHMGEWISVRGTMVTGKVHVTT